MDTVCLGNAGNGFNFRRLLGLRNSGLGRFLGLGSGRKLFTYSLDFPDSSGARPFYQKAKAGTFALLVICGLFKLLVCFIRHLFNQVRSTGRLFGAFFRRPRYKFIFGCRSFDVYRHRHFSSYLALAGYQNRGILFKCQFPLLSGNHRRHYCLYGWSFNSAGYFDSVTD